MRPLLILVACLLPILAHAQDTEYRRLTDSAVQEHDLGHYEEARALFAKAHEINPNARTWWGMGAAAFEARQYLDAIHFLSQALEDPRKPLTDEQRKNVSSLIVRSREFLVRLRVDVTPKSASVAVDGVELEPDATGVALLDLGSHEVLVSAPGYQPSTRGVRWPAGEVTLHVELVPTAGTHAIEAGASTTRPVDAPRDATPRALPVLKWVSLGAAVASFGVAGAGLALRNTAADELNDADRCPSPRATSCPQEVKTVNRGEIMGIVGLSAGGLFTALTIALFVVDKRKQSSKARAWACYPDGFAAVGCRTQF